MKFLGEGSRDLPQDGAVWVPCMMEGEGLIVLKRPSLLKMISSLSNSKRGGVFVCLL